jgi:hypothetical protein
LISLTESYLRKTLPKLPDFTAARTVVSYEEDPQYGEDDIRVAYKPLHLSDRYKEKVLYRDGHEVTNAELKKNKTPGPEDRYLITRGTFGPFLGWVGDAIAVPDALTWSRWEQSGNERLAVFRYQVPVEKSRFQIKGCCLPDGGEVKGFIKTTGYSGEIAIDPQSGAILRLVFRADLTAIPPSSGPTSWSNMVRLILEARPISAPCGASHCGEGDPSSLSRARMENLESSGHT